MGDRNANTRSDGLPCETPGTRMSPMAFLQSRPSHSTKATVKTRRKRAVTRGSSHTHNIVAAWLKFYERSVRLILEMQHSIGCPARLVQ